MSEQSSRYSSGSVAFGRGGGTVTLVEQTSFCLSAHGGDVLPAAPRRLRRRHADPVAAELRIAGHAPSRLGRAGQRGRGRLRPPHAASRGQADSPLMVLRRADRGRGPGRDPRAAKLRLRPPAHRDHPRRRRRPRGCLDVKQGRTEVAPDVGRKPRASACGSSGARRERRAARRRGAGGRRTHQRVPRPLDRRAAGGGSWSAGHRPLTGPQPCGPPDRCSSAALVRLRAPVLAPTRAPASGVPALVARPGRPPPFGPDPDGLPVVAAGAPWFMTLFGRDSLLTAYMAPLVDHDLALGVLETLARHQGPRVDPATEEQPGRILHECPRRPAPGSLYGTATPRRSSSSCSASACGGACRGAVEPLLPHADRALDVDRAVRRPGRRRVGGVQRLSARGLAEPGLEGLVRTPSSSPTQLARTPIALCEVQGYLYAAFGPGRLARWAGDTDRAEACERRAQPAGRFDEAFWLPEAGTTRWRWTATSAPSTRSPRTSVTAVDRDRRAGAGRRARRPALLPGDVHRVGHSHARVVDPGLQPVELPQRVGLAARHSPVVAGLASYGLTEPRAVSLEAAGRRHGHGGRLPELFCGLSRRRTPSRSHIPRRAPRRPGRQPRRCSCCGPCWGSPRTSRRAGWTSTRSRSTALGARAQRRPRRRRPHPPDCRRHPHPPRPLISGADRSL